MKILRGKQQGASLTPHQFANDWISVKESTDVFRPSSVQLEPADLPLFEKTDTAHVGRFWIEWKLLDDGTFRSLSPRRRRTRSPATRTGASR
jgi:hypothetical protein